MNAVINVAFGKTLTKATEENVLRSTSVNWATVLLIQEYPGK
jgi:hypothetical protein